MDNPLVSIIVPVYNTELYLGKCLDSLIHQSLSEIEIIIVNDCSTGDTDSIIKKYQKDKRIQYFKFNENRGLSAARNYGLKKARGKYVVFCDSDDWVDIFLYENMYNTLERTKADIAVCGTKKEFPSGEDSVIKADFEKEVLLNNDAAFRIMTFQYAFGITITPSATNKMVRRSLLNKYSVVFLEGVYYEDLLYSSKIMIYANNIVCIPHYYYHYFRRQESTIISISKHHIDSFYLIFDEMKKFLIEEKLFDFYKLNYYKFGERFYNLIIRQIFEFAKDEMEKKELIEYSVSFIKKLITLSDFIEYSSAEKLRKHIQPYISDTKIV